MPVESLILVAALAQPSVQTPTRGGAIAELIQHDVGSWVRASLVELDALLNDRDIPNDLRPTGHAYLRAWKRLVETSVLLDRKPEIVLDGEGGIDIEWESNGRLLMYSCRANSNQRDYIYYEGEAYGGDYYTPIYSTDRLDWFLRG